MSTKFENLNVWQSAKELCLFVYKIADNFPAKEQFALTSQTTRAAVSIVANIAEGSSRPSQKDFCHFLDMSLGSAFELETLLIIAYERGYINIKEKDTANALITITEKQLNGFRRKLKL